MLKIGECIQHADVSSTEAQVDGRYFTERRHASGLAAIPFQPGVDDFAILGRHDPQHIFHCEENRVDFVAQADGKTQP